MQAQPSFKDEFVFAALLLCSAIPYNEVMSVFLVERLGPFLALACAAAYCITLLNACWQGTRTGLARMVPCSPHSVCRCCRAGYSDHPAHHVSRIPSASQSDYTGAIGCQNDHR